MSTKGRLSMLVLGLAVGACAGAPSPDKPVPSDIRIFHAQDIPNPQVHFIWMELPTTLDLGSNEIRVFMARTEPPSMVVPTESELPCMLQSETEHLALAPIPITFEYDGSQLVGSYSWKACGSCVECYMNWETRMEIVGTLADGKMDLSLAIRHFGLNIQGDFLQVQLTEETPTPREPSILCTRTFTCQQLDFVPRP